MSNDFFDDEYDPLAPPTDGVTADDGADDDALDVPAPASAPADGEDNVDDLESEGDGGFGDGEGLVRLWFDEDGLLEKVRVSPVWFQKLGPGQTLEQAFHRALQVTHLTVGDVGEWEETDVDAIDFSDLPPFSKETMEAYLAMLADHHQRWNEAIERFHAQPPPVVPTVQGKSAGVTVRLNKRGNPESVHFDEDWLDQAQVGAICTNVLAATHKAYEKYVPRTDDRLAELERYRIEHDVLIAGLHALVKPRRN